MDSGDVNIVILAPREAAIGAVVRSLCACQRGVEAASLRDRRVGGMTTPAVASGARAISPARFYKDQSNLRASAASLIRTAVSTLPR